MKDKKYNYLDPIDLDRINIKIKKLTNIIDWLERLKELDTTANIAEINKTIAEISKEKELLIKKYNKGYKIICEEVDVLTQLYDNM